MISHSQRYTYTQACRKFFNLHKNQNRNKFEIANMGGSDKNEKGIQIQKHCWHNSLEIFFFSQYSECIFYLCFAYQVKLVIRADTLHRTVIKIK